MQIKGQKITVMGLARTGLAAARFLASHDAQVTATDMRSEAELSAVLTELAGLDINFVLGSHNINDFTKADLVVVSPGVPREHPLLQQAVAAGVKVISEVELAACLIDAPLAAVTGTNGKTTTVTLLDQMLRASGFDSHLGGNVGTPLIEVAEQLSASRSQADQVVVAEISSFQLEWIEQFRPRVAALLNISEDHLDRYQSYQDYIDAKLRIFENMTGSDHAVVNYDDPLVWQAAQKISARLFPFSRFHSFEERGIFLHRDCLVARDQGNEFSFPLEVFKLHGVHNLENIMAALGCALLMGCKRDDCLTVLENFTPLQHRMQFVREVNGVRYFEDSKATNVGSVVKALESFERVVLIAGGKDKGGSYMPLAELVRERVSHLILIGEATERMQQELGGFTDCQRADSLPEAVIMASQAAVPGDVVLLSPACSSFDMFKDYEERARCFVDAVRGLA
jgi:UDP-N-acetylmuramoylalanine--D-glutamate ligase